MNHNDERDYAEESANANACPACYGGCPECTPTVSAPTVGDRVAVAPHTDAFMQGDRYGVVTNYTIDPAGVDRYRVRLDRSGRSRIFGADDVSKIGA